MNNCEIVDNVACGQTFQYCRTHKVESKDCPGNKKPEGLESLAALQYQINQAAAALTPCRYAGLGSPCIEHLGCNSRPVAPTSKREFKVGDKVRHVPASPYAAFYSRYGFAGGAEATVVDPRCASSIEVQTVTGQVAFLESEWLEHV